MLGFYTENFSKIDINFSIKAPLVAQSTFKSYRGPGVVMFSNFSLGSDRTLFLIEDLNKNLESILGHICLPPGEVSEEYSEIQAHRKKYYTHSAPHLLQPEELDREFRVDSKSHLIALRFNSHIVASLRLTPRPFEVEEIDSHSISFINYSDYVEIGRLVTDPDLDSLTQAMIVRYLLCFAGLKAFNNLGYAGLVAICRPNRASFFAKFGMFPCGKVYSSQRNIFYHFLAAPKSMILEQTHKLQNNDQALLKRLKRTFNQTNRAG